jgi:predicted MFS family arabinose efflux permease
MMHADAPPARWLVPTLTLAVFVNLLGAIALGPFLPVVAADLGVSVAMLGQIPAVMNLLAALLGLVIGPLADRFGYRRTLLVGLLAVLASSLATGLAPTFPILILVTLVGAIGRAAVLPVSQAVVATRFADETLRRAALGRISTGQSGAVILGIPLLTTIAALLHWRGAFFVLAALALVVSSILVRMLPLDEPRAGGATRLRSSLAAYGPLLRHRPSLALILGGWLGNGSFWVIGTYVGAFYVQRHGFSTQEVGWVYLAIGLGALVGQLLAGGRLGSRPGTLVIASRTAFGCLTGASLLLPLPAPVAVALLTLGMVAQGLSNVGAIILLSSGAPTGRATALTVNGSAASLAGALGGGLGGLLLAVGGYLTLGWCVLILALTAAGVVWWSRIPYSPLSPPRRFSAAC